MTEWRRIYITDDGHVGYIYRSNGEIGVTMDAKPIYVYRKHETVLYQSGNLVISRHGHQINIRWRKP